MSREAWGDPPDPEPQSCPNCGETQHTPGCEWCEMDMRRIAAEQAASVLRCKLRALVEAHDALQSRNFVGGAENYERQRDALRTAWAAARAALTPNYAMKEQKP